MSGFWRQCDDRSSSCAGSMRLLLLQTDEDHSEWSSCPLEH